jgi:hypothetical protein
MTHWHFWRFTFCPERSKGDILDVDLFFARDRFTDPGEATEALTSDVVSRYPAAKRLPALAEAMTKMPEHPEAAAFQYAIPGGDWAMWRLAKCAGDCEKVCKRIERELRAALPRVTGLPLEGANGE